MVSCSQPDPNQPDFLSTLPDDLLITILSFLPIHIAARTSILSRRFRHLWEASPSLNLTTLLCSKFVDIADRVLLHRNPSYPLLSLRLDYYASLVPDLYVLSLLAKAHSLGLRHLTVSGLDIKPILPSIFSINSLQSLSLSFPVVKSNFIFPSGSKLTSLRSLSVEVCAIYPIDELGRFIYELCSLEDLNLQIHANDTNILCSKSIRKLKLIMFGGRNVRLRTLWLLLPSLESLYLKTPRLLSSVFEVDADVPLLKNAVISLVDVHAEDVNAVTRLLNSISHVEELSLRVAELQSEKHLVPILLEPGKAVPNFHNLKRLDVHLCIHENSFEAVIIMLHNFPNLELLKLVHEIQKFT
ncbi:F-box/FBD/LRR protein [Rhynchospora pubera]|uniref:F-box/FBD/LRR protein n=1 Tax=Rhynchospora pubera TaxID=906938 RepID=A0AAV8CXJ0_9POAL|nr:F-box/FBD/LRR protein [Rhynchospora pubera]